MASKNAIFKNFKVLVDEKKLREKKLKFFIVAYFMADLSLKENSVQRVVSFY